jgi:hypothetical protein
VQESTSSSITKNTTKKTTKKKKSGAEHNQLEQCSTTHSPQNKNQIAVNNQEPENSHENPNTTPNFVLSTSDDLENIVFARPPDSYKMPQESEAEQIYREIYGGIFLQVTQVQALSQIPNLQANVFRDVCRRWQANGYRSTSIGSIINAYENELQQIANRRAGVSGDNQFKNGIVEHSTTVKRKFLH